MERVKSNRSFTRVNLLAAVGIAAAVVLFLAGSAFLSRSAATAATVRSTPTLGMDSVAVGNYVDLVSNRLVMPVSARVKGPDGVLADATVVFAVDSGAAGFWVEGQSGLSSEVTVSSDADGIARAWLFLPVDFTATNLLSITADDGDNTVQARLSVVLDDYSGTGTLQTNWNKVPGPLSVATRVRLLNPDELGGGGGGRMSMMSEVAGFTGGDVFLSTELFLEPRGYSNDATYLTLHNTATNMSYQLLWKFDFNNETNWHAGQTVTGNGSNLDFTPVPAYGHQKMFFAVTTNSPANTVSINFTNGIATNAVEPDSTNSDPGLVVVLRVARTGSTNAALPVFFNLSGSAAYTNDYSLQYTNGTAVTNGTIVIPAGATNIDLVVQPVDDQVAEFDESVVVLLMSHGGYFVDTNHAMVQFLIEDNPGTNLFELVYHDMPTPVGIDYHPVSNALILSVNFNSNGYYPNFYIVTTNDAGDDVVADNWSSIIGLTNEIKLAVVQTTTNGFTAGDMYFGTGTNGVVGKLSADGTTWNLKWLTLPDTNGSNTLLRGGLYVDQTGVFGNDLIVVTGGFADEGGQVWRISQTNGLATNAVLLANLADNPYPHLEGVTTLPDDPLTYGPWAGKIITGAESAQNTNGAPQPRIYTITPGGIVATNYWGISPEDFDLIQPNQDLYAVSETLSLLEKVSRSRFTNHLNDLLVTQSGEIIGFANAQLVIVHWDSTNLLHYQTVIPHTNGALEHVTFAPLDLPVPPP
ncbi:MAG: hypothetical protein HY301_11525 [Verrucomicrobia bacterium]|nr:hypothetical protein [Verrucomicrobiota bacterium]